MERPLAIGDWAIVTYGRFSKEFPIIGINNRGILIGDESSPSLIVLGANKTWQVYGMKSSHSVSFTPAIQGIPVVNDALRTIMMSLDYASLRGFCETNKKYADLCADENFWAQKIEKDYPGALQYRPSDLTFRKLYKHLSYVDGDIVRALEHGYVYVLDYLFSIGKWVPIDIGVYFGLMAKAPLSSFIWLMNHESTMYHRGASVAAEHNRIDILQWMAQLDPPILPEHGNILGVVMRANETTIKWIADHMHDPQLLAQAAVHVNNIKVLRLLASLPHPIFPSMITLETMAYKINYNTLMYLSQSNPQFKISPTLHSNLLKHPDPRVTQWVRKEYHK
jgi:hypothetical protein